MKTREIIRHMAKTSGKSLRGLSRELGRDSTWLSASIHQKSEMRVDILAEVARACGYNLVLIGHDETIEVSPNEYTAYSVSGVDPDGRDILRDVLSDGSTVTKLPGDDVYEIVAPDGIAYRLFWDDAHKIHVSLRLPDGTDFGESESFNNVVRGQIDDVMTMLAQKKAQDPTQRPPE